MAIGDVNGDGRNDVVMVTSYYFDAANDYTLHVWTQNSDGTLASRVKYYLGGSPQSVAIGDVNGDGRNDVVVALGNAIGVLLQNAQGTLDSMVAYPTTDSRLVRVADLNHDGLQDVVAIGWGTQTASVLLQQGGGGLGTPVVYAVPHDGYDDLEVGDVNGDGLTDVIVMSGQGFSPNFSVLYQKADGTLGGLISRSIGINQLAGGIGVGDVTGDTKSDVVVGMNWAGGGTPSVAVFPQQLDGSVPAEPSETLTMVGYPEPVEVGDVTNDKRPDVVAFDYGIYLGIFRQLAGGQLGGEQLLPFPYATHLNRHGIAIGDINGDGYNDIVVANYNYGLVVYLNTGPRVVVTAPAGQIVVGVPTSIAWTADGGDFSSFDVSYSVDGGASYTPVPGCTGLLADTVSCSWISPAPVTNDGRIKVVGRVGSGAVLATGVGSIAIVTPSLTVLSPNTSVIWPAGTTQGIAWSSNLPSEAKLAIDLSRDGGSTWGTLAGSVANTGGFLWTVTNPSTGKGRIRVSWVDNPAISDESNVDFTIDRPPVANAGPDVTIELGASATLNGVGSSDPDGDPLLFTWYKNGIVVGIGSTAVVQPGLGTTAYSLTVADPFGQVSTDFVNVTVEDTTPPIVIVVQPAAGSALEVGAPAWIEWTAADNGAITFFDVSASNDSGATYSPVAGCTHLPGNARSCSWRPNATTTGTAVVRVVGRDSLGNGGAGGASYAVSAAPYIKVLAPNGHQVWPLGSLQTISWSHNLGAGSSVAIELSRDGGATWEWVVGSVPNVSSTNGTYSWRVTGPRTLKARIRVSSAQPTLSDMSDSNFTIDRRRLVDVSSGER